MAQGAPMFEVAEKRRGNIHGMGVYDSDMHTHTLGSKKQKPDSVTQLCTCEPKLLGHR